MSTLRIEIFPDDLDLAANFYVEVLDFHVERDERTRAPAHLALRRGDVRVGAAECSVITSSQRRPPLGVEPSRSLRTEEGS